MRKPWNKSVMEVAAKPRIRFEGDEYYGKLRNKLRENYGGHEIVH